MSAHGGSQPWIVLCVQNLPVPKDRRVWREARTLAGEGRRVAVIAPRGKGESWTQHIDGVEILRFPAGPALPGIAGLAAETAAALVGTAVLLLRLRRRAPIAVLHAANPPDTFFVFGALLRLAGARFVFDQHDLCPELVDVRLEGAPPVVRGALRSVLRLLERASYGTAGLVVAPNSSYRRIALGRGRCRPESVVVVRSGPDAVQPRIPPPPRGDRPLVVAFAGVMGVQDHLEVLLDATATLLARRPGSIAVDLIGEGDDVPRLRARAESLGIAGSVTWAGWLTGDTLDRRLGAVDIAVSLDDDSPFNRMSTMTKVPEYVALGLASVVADLPENRVSAGEAALYFRPGDATDLAKRLEELLDDPELVAHLERAAVERAPQLLWEASGRRLAAAYRWLLDGGPTVPGDQPLPA